MNNQKSPLKAVAGHVKDLYRIARFDFVNPHSLSKLRQISGVRRRTGAGVFIETGTYLGNTAMRASRFFERVITIELDPDLHQKASEYLRTRPNVECICGDANQLLASVLERDDVTDAVVFLDGHFSKGVTAQGDTDEPACEELATLSRYLPKVSGIVIDDFRCFGPQTSWPTKSELLYTCEKYFDGEYRIAVHLDQVIIEKSPGGGSVYA